MSKNILLFLDVQKNFIKFFLQQKYFNYNYT